MGDSLLNAAQSFILHIAVVIQAFFRVLVEAVVFVVFLVVVLRLLDDDPVDLLDLLVDFFVDALASKSPSAVSSVKSSTD